MSPSAIGRPCQTAAAAASEERYNDRRDAGWSSQVARRAHNPEVAGSNPAPATEKAPETGPFLCLSPAALRELLPNFCPVPPRGGACRHLSAVGTRGLRTTR